MGNRREGGWAGLSSYTFPVPGVKWTHRERVVCYRAEHPSPDSQLDLRTRGGVPGGPGQVISSLLWNSFWVRFCQGGLSWHPENSGYYSLSPWSCTCSLNLCFPICKVGRLSPTWHVLRGGKNDVSTIQRLDHIQGSVWWNLELSTKKMIIIIIMWDCYLSFFLWGEGVGFCGSFGCFCVVVGFCLFVCLLRWCTSCFLGI